MTDLILLILCTLGVISVLLLLALTHLAIIEKNQRDQLNGKYKFPKDDYEK